MTISQNSGYVLEHPYTKKAARDFLSGDMAAMKFIFDLLQIDMYQETAVLCSKAYKLNKKENFPIVEAAIRDVAPPSRLNVRLPIPPPMEPCKVVPLSVVKKPKVPTRVAIQNQLSISFPVSNKKASLLKEA